MKRMVCFECGMIDNYEMKKVEREYKGEGYQFTMSVSVPFCKKCGAPLVDEEIEEKIAEKANEKIRESRGIIKKEEIIGILERYHVSQKFLSRILGWGEITLTRYISGGYTPGKVNSDKLKSLNNPYVLQDILYERIKESDGEIKRETAFLKLQENVNKAIEEIEDKEGKIYQIADWFLEHSSEEEPVTHPALQKLLYFSQGWSYIINQKELFDEDCEAWENGAVYLDVYQKFNSFKYEALPVIKTKSRLHEQEMRVLSYVKKYYLDVYSVKSLEKICHLEAPYISARKGYEKEEKCKKHIDKRIICDYYTKIAEKYGISSGTPYNIQLYLKDLLTLQN